MSYEERGTWVYLLVSVGVYLAYVAVVASHAADPITATAYQVPLLWSVGAAILAAIALRIVTEIGVGVSAEVAYARKSQGADRPERRGIDQYRTDVRDREIDRRGNQYTWGVIAAGALAALLMALAEWPFFWIANVIYLGFVLQAVSSAIVKLVLYRRGF